MNEYVLWSAVGAWMYSPEGSTEKGRKYVVIGWHRYGIIKLEHPKEDELLLLFLQSTFTREDFSTEFNVDRSTDGVIEVRDNETPDRLMYRLVPRS